MSVLLLWDASGYVKRFTEEEGVETVRALTNHLPMPRMMITSWGYAEVYSILVRRCNGGLMPQSTLQPSLVRLKADLLDAPEFEILTIPDAMIFAGLPLIQRHNLNSSDAAILAAYLGVQEYVAPTGTHCLLVSADKRLNRAADAEGLPSLNPETVAADRVPPLLASL